MSDKSEEGKRATLVVEGLVSAFDGIGAGRKVNRVSRMVDRFLSWKLPEHFNPDCGISFNPEYNVEYMASLGKPPMRHEPTGTNLFDADQAKAMIEYLLGDEQPQEKVVKVSELEGVELDYWVAMAHDKDGGEHWIEDGKTYKGGYWSGHSTPKRMCGLLWRPSKDWSQGGPLIDEYWEAISSQLDNWSFEDCGEYSPWQAWETFQKNKLVWFMRALVASKYGDTINTPLVYPSAEK